MPRTMKKTIAPIEKHTIPTVPEAEWPYQVPENWLWVRLGSIIKLISGRDATLSECNDIGIGIPYILGASNIENNKFMIERWIEKPIVVSNKGDILLSVKGTIGKLYIQTENKINISRQIMAIHPYNMCNTRYAYYFLSSICDKLKEAGNGLIPGISRKDILDSIFPLPPLAEQQRIVDRIERLFAKLDEAREKAQAVVDGFENRKAAILHQAFTGELTKKWREERGIGMESWEFYKYSELGNSKLGKMLDKAKNDGQPIRYLRNVNVRWFDFDLTDVYTMLATDEEVNNLEVRDGDMFICEGGEPGRCAIWHGDCQRMIFQKALHRFRPNNKVISDYLCYYLYYLSHNGSLEKYYTGTTIKHLTGKALAEIEVFVPDITEQRIIIKSITNIFAQEHHARDLAESVIAQIDGMKKAILARAFRGELGTNDPSEAACEV